MRIFLRLIDAGLPIAGVLVIVGALLPEMALEQIGGVLLGALMIQAGISRVSRHFLPDDRKFFALRVESELFLTLMRQLNTTALALKENDSPENRREFEEIREAVRQTVERIAGVAGNAVKHMAEEAAQPDSGALWKNDFFGSP